LVLLSFCFSSLLLAEKENSFIIKNKAWEKAVKGIDYTETYKEVNDPAPKNVDIKPLNYDWSSLKYLFYIAVIGLVVFLIIKILSNLNRNPNIKKQDISVESIQEIEEKLHEIDLDKLLEEAIQGKKFHIALRINFLIIIKLLSEQGAINWAKEKTNWEYYTEINDITIKDGFKAIIMIFEPVWYGEHFLTEEGFYVLQPSFSNYKNRLKTNE